MSFLTIFDIIKYIIGKCFYMMINILLVVIGFFLLIKGADVFVNAISETSINLKIPKIIISLTIVAFGTSAPELFISFQGLLNGNSVINS